MPHLTFEYTDNLEVDVQPLLARLREEVVAIAYRDLKEMRDGIALTEHNITTKG